MTEQHTDEQNTEWGKASGVAALERAFSILHCFRAGEEAVSLAELARRTGLYKSTILRLLGSLEYGGFVRKLPDGNYSVGPEPLRLAQIYQDSFRVKHVIQPVLQQLSKESGETSSFYVRQGNSRIVLHRVEPSRTVRFSVREGERFPIEHGASGKVLQAFSQPHPKGFEEARERLWCVSYGERDPETASASVPVFGIGQELQGALTVSGPKERIGSVAPMRNACRLLLAAGAQVTAALGGDPGVFAHSLEQLDTVPFPTP
ncbi:IclR family transcriptional regulator [Pseudogulbenkiania sp. MAI-1]|uniref:IclR family transcriptional regulator n=1 Tax=Pseudogulbenkiania sp. MAI-1 TaxID=990370 RepID=UPI00045EBDB3|nr:IclR family transcriptional regulator [Pseudogulbenkiania sp. MAI-1]